MIPVLKQSLTRVLALALPLFSAALHAEDAPISPEHKKFFEDKVQPILAKACIRCHSVAEGKVKGGLALDGKAAEWKGDTGASIKPGDPKGSLFIKAITYEDDDLQMPPKGDKLPAEDIATLIEWVKMGAPDPRAGGVDIKTAKMEAAKKHFAFKPITRPEIPKPSAPKWCQTPVDAFILAKLDEKGLRPAPSLNQTIEGKETLLRRAYFDLIGLPPTMKDMKDFLTDTSPQAFSKVIDKLLASPHYGERWGRYWLDTARYSDTKGSDNNNNMANGDRHAFAYTYRDWVISAFNSDMPYDMFLKNQIAADLMDDNEKPNLAALGFLTLGKRFQDQNEVINDRIDVIGRGMMGLTIACARCHDHMFDPVTQKDYYALHGVFSSTFEPDEENLPVIAGDETSEAAKNLKAKISEYHNADCENYFSNMKNLGVKFREKAQDNLKWLLEEDMDTKAKLQDDLKIDRATQDLLGRNANGKKNDPVLGPLVQIALEKNNPKLVLETLGKNQGNRYNKMVVEALVNANATTKETAVGAFLTAIGQISSQADDVYKALAYNVSQGDNAHPLDKFDPALVELITFPMVGRSKPFQRSKITSNGPEEILTPTVLKDSVAKMGLTLRGIFGGKMSFGKQNLATLKSGNDDGAIKKAMVLSDKAKPVDSPVFIRGMATQKGQIVPRRFLEVLSNGDPTPFKQGSGRLELAEAVVNKDNPLTARVLVNRVWMNHFGEGFVRTPDDLGVKAEAPSHPELLDFLSHWFMEQGWSIKMLHRVIMLSKVYQLSSDITFSPDAKIRAAMKKQADEADPENRYLWHANVRRLDFEALRDSLLYISGQLSTTAPSNATPLTMAKLGETTLNVHYLVEEEKDDMHIVTGMPVSGPSIQPGTVVTKVSLTSTPFTAKTKNAKPMLEFKGTVELSNPAVVDYKGNDILFHWIGGIPVNVDPNAAVPSKRRSIYGYVDRRRVPEVMTQFDFSNPEQPNSKRTSTIVPQQALFMMNSPFILNVIQGLMNRPETRDAMATRRAAAVYDTFFRLVLQRSMGSMDAKLQALGAGNFQGYTLKICQNLVEKESRRQKEEEGASKDRVEYFTKMMEANKKRAEQMEAGNAEIGITNEGDAQGAAVLTPLETLVQAIIFSNEFAFVN
jgi:cytochrome c553